MPVSSERYFLGLITQAVKAVPQVRWALGVVGIIAALALILSFRIPPIVAVFGFILMLIFMTALLLFAYAVRKMPQQGGVAVQVFIWFILLFFIGAALALFMAATVNRPWHLRDFIEKQIGIENKVSTNVSNAAADLAAGSNGQPPKALPPLKTVDSMTSSQLYQLGNANFYGYKGKIDISKALQYYKSAADKGNRNAMFQLGTIYYNGTNVTLDYPTAKKWWELAANKDDPDAMQMLAILIYMQGNGVDKDYREAVRWLEKAVSACNRGCLKKDTIYDMKTLASIYQTGGPNLKADEDKAAEWKERAEKQETGQL